MNKKTKIFLITLSLAIIVAIISAVLFFIVLKDNEKEYDHGKKEEISWRIEDGVLIISGKGDMEDYYYGDDMAPWYDRKDEIESIVVEEGITSIGSYAFSLMTNKSVSLPESLRKIGRAAFELNAIESITIPEGVRSIGAGAFSGCTLLAEVFIPKNVTEMAYSCMFAQCNSLERIEVAPDNPVLTSVDGVLCNKETKQLVECPPAKKGSFVCPDWILSISNGAFAYCKSLTDIKLPDGLLFISIGAFENCEGLTEITVPNSVLSIGSSAFRGCTALKTVTLPRSVNSIYYTAFEGLSDLTIYCPEDSYSYYYLKDDHEVVTTESEPNTDFSWSYEDGVLTLSGNGNMPDYRFNKKAAPWSIHSKEIKKVIINEGITSIGSSAFQSFEMLENVMIPNTVKYIGSAAFYNCSSMREINLPDSVISIGDDAFAACFSLEKLNLNEGLLGISDGIYNSSDCLKKLTLPKSLIMIGSLFISSNTEVICDPGSYADHVINYTY